MKNGVLTMGWVAFSILLLRVRADHVCVSKKSTSQDRKALRSGSAGCASGLADEVLTSVRGYANLTVRLRRIDSLVTVSKEVLQTALDAVFIDAETCPQRLELFGLVRKLMGDIVLPETVGLTLLIEATIH